MSSAVEASFFSAVFGQDASADTGTANNTQGNKNSDLYLHEANTSLASILDKDSKDNNKIEENTTVNIASENALIPSATPIVEVPGLDENGDISNETSVYVIREGDNLADIAKMFGVSPNTILLANDIKKGDKLQKDDILIIPPISGKEHTITKGQTIQTIAKFYNVDPSDIAIYNGITEETDLVIGDKLMIPGADGMSDGGSDKPVKNLVQNKEKDTNYYISHPLQNLVGFFINPLPTGVLTQGLHDGRKAIDIGAPIGSSIYASASGTVIFAKTGTRSRYSNGGFGGLTIIRHSNGVETYYAHQSKILVHAGEQVSQGQKIGEVGTTGHSTGPHLHFQVEGARNPGLKWFQ